MALRVEAAQVGTNDANLPVYRDPEVVAHYAALDYLTACERLLFDAYLKPGAAILDLGVGGGRTTSYLSQKASHYVGVDYSAEMIHLCRGRFPQLEFMVADAADLAKFSDRSFDAIVFSFNGLDYLYPEKQRLKCLRECYRVLRSGGVLVFSSHNARSVLSRPAWDRKRLRTFAGKVVPEQSILFPAALGALTVLKSVHAFSRAAFDSAGRILRRVPRTAFWRGEGYWLDPAHGGLMTHCSTPRQVRDELTAFDFRFEVAQGDEYPRRSRSLVTDWYYYVFSKVERTRGDACA